MPKPMEDAVLGRFTWDQENGFWLGTVDVPPNDSTWLTLQVGPSERRAALALAREAAGRIRELEPEARRFLAAELVFGNEEVFSAVEFFVWFDGDGDRGIIVMDESQLSGEGGTP
jgi:hypothetical protein